MGRTKEKRIKRLKKKRIWPSVLGLFFILLIFAIVIAFGAAAVLMEVTNRKLTEGYEKSVKVAELYRESVGGSLSGDESRLHLYLDVIDDVKAISVVDKEGNGVWSSDGVFPDVTKATGADFSFLGNQGAVKLIVEGNASSLYVDEDGIVTINESILFRQIHNNFFTIFTNSTESLLQFNVWFLIPAEASTVCVLNTVNVYGYDIQMILVVLVTIGILIGVFSLYYIISFVSVIISQRKTTKIIYTDMITGGENWFYFTK